MPPGRGAFSLQSFLESFGANLARCNIYMVLEAFLPHFLDRALQILFESCCRVSMPCWRGQVLALALTFKGILTGKSHVEAWQRAAVRYGLLAISEFMNLGYSRSTGFSTNMCVSMTAWPIGASEDLLWLFVARSMEMLERSGAGLGVKRMKHMVPFHKRDVSSTCLKHFIGRGNCILSLTCWKSPQK